MDERLYIVTYDIASPARWRRVYRVMQGHGEWTQYSVFQCRMTRRRMAELQTRLDELIHHGEDHVLFVDVGPAGKVSPRFTSLGKRFEVTERKVVVV